MPLEEVGAYDDLQFGNHDDVYASVADHRLLIPRGDCPLSVLGRDGEGRPEVPFRRIGQRQ
eukprot:5015440-Heterocapsa_arctica.AAC.1